MSGFTDIYDKKSRYKFLATTEKKHVLTWQISWRHVRRTHWRTYFFQCLYAVITHKRSIKCSLNLNCNTLNWVEKPVVPSSFTLLSWLMVCLKLVADISVSPHVISSVMTSWMKIYCFWNNQTAIAYTSTHIIVRLPRSAPSVLVDF